MLLPRAAEAPPTYRSWFVNELGSREGNMPSRAPPGAPQPYRSWARLGSEGRDRSRAREVARRTLSPLVRRFNAAARCGRRSRTAVAVDAIAVVTGLVRREQAVAAIARSGWSGGQASIVGAQRESVAFPHVAPRTTARRANAAAHRSVAASAAWIDHAVLERGSAGGRSRATAPAERGSAPARLARKWAISCQLRLRQV